MNQHTARLTAPPKPIREPGNAKQAGQFFRQHPLAKTLSGSTLLPVNDRHGPLHCIADLIEASPHDTLAALSKDLDDIARMAAKARALFRSRELTQPEAFSIYSRLAERGTFKEYAFSSIEALLNQPEIPASLARKARTLKARTEKVDADLQETILRCYLHISKRLSDIQPLEARRAINLSDLTKQLQRASEDLSKLLHNVNIVAKLTPVPVTLAHIEKARTELRHNRAEIAIAAAQLPSHSTGNLEADSMLIAVQESIISIARTLDALELAYKDMEVRIKGGCALPATVH